jgi:hypothetical protein
MLVNGFTTLLKMESPLLTEVLKIALNETGVCEEPPGSNRGFRVEQYLNSVRMNPGNPWCAAFVYFCFELASVRLNRANPLVRTAGCLQHWRNTKGLKITAKEAITTPLLLVPGAIFIIDRGRGKGHTGIVTGVSSGLIHTIEGNTDPDHSAEGGGVWALERRIESVNLGFIIYC